MQRRQDGQREEQPQRGGDQQQGQDGVARENVALDDLEDHAERPRQTSSSQAREAKRQIQS